MIFAIIRNGVTATSTEIGVVEVNLIRRWVASSLRGSGIDSNKYHFMAWSCKEDISSTDRLEEITGTITGTVYSIINKREIEEGKFEFDLEPYATSASKF